jgi:LuxR family transcriptional regulator, maltose regulon positive regulatory protein
VSGDALEFGAGDLALDAVGARQIFAQAQVSVPPELAAEVADRAEGWPAGLYLAAVIAKQSRGQVRIVTGEDTYVADYLYREALIGQPKAVQRFLRRTAVLEQLCGPLCEAVLGSSAAAMQLRRIEAHSLFLTPLDRQRQWYRYHALYREFLLGELRRTEPGIIATLHQRAADWYESHGLPALALEHLLHTGDWDRSVRLAARLCLPTFMAGQLSTVQRWLAALGEANVARYPPLAVLACWEGVLTGDTARAERRAAVVDAASFEGGPASGAASFDSARALLRAGMCAAGPEQMMADAAFSLAREPAWSPVARHRAVAGRRSAPARRAPRRGPRWFRRGVRRCSRDEQLGHDPHLRSPARVARHGPRRVDAGSRTPEARAGHDRGAPAARLRLQPPGFRRGSQALHAPW